MSKDNERSYDAIATQFADDRSKSEVHECVADFVKRLKPGDSVLDIGCGTGIPNAKYISKKGLMVTGIDISTKLINKAKKNTSKVKFIQADIAEFQTNEGFDGIIAWDSLFHLRLNEHEPVFRKIYSFLKFNGFFLFTHGGGTGGEITGEMFGHQFSYSTLGPKKTKQLLLSLGFAIIRWKIYDQGSGYMIGLVQKSYSQKITCKL